MTDIAIRPYRADDLEACRGLWRELTQRHRDIYDDQMIGGDDPASAFDEHLLHPHLAGVWVALRDGAILALHGLLIEGDGGEVEPIVVTEAARSHGIGRRLLDHAIAEARRRGVRFLSIRPVARNIEALALFHETGFRTLGHLDMFMDLTNAPPRTWRQGITVHGREFSF